MYEVRIIVVRCYSSLSYTNKQSIINYKNRKTKGKQELTAVTVCTTVCTRGVQKIR